MTPLAITFDWAVDITGLATVLLALATAYLALTTRSQAKATAQQVGISQTQVSRSHRPVLVPEQKNIKVRFRGGEVHAVGPEFHANPRERNDLPTYAHVIVALKNIGMGPALHIRGGLMIGNDAFKVQSPIEGLGAGEIGAVVFERWQERETDDFGDFAGDLEYEDVAGTTYRTEMSWQSGPFAYRVRLVEQSGLVPEGKGTKGD